MLIRYQMKKQKKIEHKDIVQEVHDTLEDKGITFEKPYSGRDIKGYSLEPKTNGFLISIPIVTVIKGFKNLVRKIRGK